jgi:hypothetical protein
MSARRHADKNHKAIDNRPTTDNRQPTKTNPTPGDISKDKKAKSITPNSILIK